MKNKVKHLGNILIIAFACLSVYKAMKYRSLPEYSDGDLINQKKIFYYSSYFEDRFYDYRIKKTLNLTDIDQRMVLAEIDDRSINALGSWPIDRKNWAEMVSKLKTYGAKIIAFDVFFPENSKTCDGYNPDDDLVKSIESFQEIPGNKAILGYKIGTSFEESFEVAPDALIGEIVNSSEDANNSLNTSLISRLVFPIEKLINVEPGLGFIDSDSDIDGVMRHYRVLTKTVDLTKGIPDNEKFEIIIPSFGLNIYDYASKIWGLYKEGENLKIELHPDDRNLLITPSGNLLVNNLGETKINWSGGMNKFIRVPILDIIQNSDDDAKMHEIFNNKIVFVGSTAFGADDLRHTPIDPMLPGVFSHMNFVKMLFDKKILKNIDESINISWLVLAICVNLMLLVQLRNNPILDIGAMITIIISAYYVDLKVLIPQGYETRLFFCFFAVIACYSWNTFIHFYMANQDKVFLKKAFQNYISPELIDDMYKSGEPPKLGGDSGIRTAFFTDIQGFSTFSEKLSPTQLVELLNEYLTAMTDILLEEKGTLDKYEGDAIIAFFGAPMPLEDHAARACMVAYRMQNKLSELRVKWASEGDKWPKIVHDMRMRIGINSGEIVTGNMGSASRMNYTMMGDSVNLAARLEESAKQYGIFTQASKECITLAGDHFVFRELDTIKVVGKSVPVTTYDLLGIKDYCEDYLKELADKFMKGIEFYKAQKWDHALSMFKETLELEYRRYPDLQGKKTNPSEIYIKRCEEYKITPPPADWDGVYTLSSK